MQARDFFKVLCLGDYAIAFNGRLPGTAISSDEIYVFNSKGKTCPNTLPNHPIPSGYEGLLVHKGQKIFIMGGKADGANSANSRFIKI